MTGEVITGTRIKPISNQQKETCAVTISDVTSADTGMYYCLAVHSSVSYFGNGSKLSVTGKKAHNMISYHIGLYVAHHMIVGYISAFISF